MKKFILLIPLLFYVGCIFSPSSKEIEAQDVTIETLSAGTRTIRIKVTNRTNEDIFDVGVVLLVGNREFLRQFANRIKAKTSKEYNYTGIYNPSQETIRALQVYYLNKKSN